jgi:hypothetical protein
MSNNQAYLTTQELSERIKYDTRTIRERLKDSVLIEGIHYFRPFGGRKILYIWEAILADMFNAMPSIKPLNFMRNTLVLTQASRR